MLPHRSTPRSEAILALSLACVVWGISFTWVKEGQAALAEALATPTNSAAPLGAVLFLAARFVLATLTWLVFFPQSLAGWSLRGCIQGFAAGALLATGLLLQHFSLIDASESLSAFLTSLAIVFTAVLSVAFFREHVSGRLWAAVGIAVVGIGLMTSFRPEGGFDRGALFGLLCAIVFGVYTLVVHHLSRGENIWRFALFQYLVCGVVFLGLSAVLSDERSLPVLLTAGAIFTTRVIIPLILLTLFVTMLGYGLMYRYQSSVSPTEAALIYTTEPLYAAAYSWIVAGRGLTPEACVGAGLLIMANALAILIRPKGTVAPSCYNRDEPSLLCTGASPRASNERSSRSD